MALKPLDNDVLKYNLLSVMQDGLWAEVPQNYLVLDLETTSLDPSDGRIWQIGLYPVIDGKPVDPDSPKGTGIYLETDEKFLRANDFEIIRRAEIYAPQFPDLNKDEILELALQDYLADVKEKGVPRQEAFRQVTDILNEYVDNQWYIVGQNCVKFDIPYYEYDVSRHGIAFTFPQEFLIDTGMLIKAAVLGRKILGRETPRAFYQAIGSRIARGVYYALERFCVPYWELDRHFGVDMGAKGHDAGYDCWVTSIVLMCLVEEANA